MKDKKAKFIITELLILAWAASVQRTKLYGEKSETVQSFVDATKFREEVVSFLRGKIIPKYINGCTVDQHYRNIESLIAYANKVNPGILSKEGYKCGVAQKLLNLSLKYYWCLGLISEPPHCPIDRIIINKTRYKGKINWTQISRRSQYEEVINEIKDLARKDGLSIPQWELTYYGRR